MRHYFRLATILAIFVLGNPNRAKADEGPSSPVTFSFLNKVAVTDKIGNCGQEDILNLIDESVADWIESVECVDVNLTRGKYGFYLGTKYVGTADEKIPSITFNFKSQSMFKATRIRIYGNATGNNSLTVKLNGKQIAMEGQLGVAKTPGTDKLDNWAAGYTVMLESVPAKTLTITGNSADIQIVAFRIFFDGMEDGSDEGDDNEEKPGISTGVADIRQDAVAVYEYFDLQGRRLSKAPECGLYIRRSNGKAEKLIAR